MQITLQNDFAAERQGGPAEMPEAIFCEGLHANRWWSQLLVGSPCASANNRAVIGTTGDESAKVLPSISSQSKMQTESNGSLTIEQQYEALKLQMLDPLKKERQSLLEKLTKVERKMSKIDPNSLNNGALPPRIDHAFHALLKQSEDGMTLLELQDALKGHKSHDRLEKSLEEDTKVEYRDGKYFLKVA